MTTMVMSFLAAAPGRFVRFLQLPRAEQAAYMRHLWELTKKEAHHYWVCAPTGLCCSKYVICPAEMLCLLGLLGRATQFCARIMTVVKRANFGRHLDCTCNCP